MNDENYYDLNDDFIDDGEMDDGVHSMIDSAIEESETGGTDDHPLSSDAKQTPVLKSRYYVLVP